MHLADLVVELFYVYNIVLKAFKNITQRSDLIFAGQTEIFIIDSYIISWWNKGTQAKAMRNLH